MKQVANQLLLPWRSIKLQLLTIIFWSTMHFAICFFGSFTIFNCREETETQRTADEESLEMTNFEYTAEPLDELTSAKLQIDALTGELQTSKSECESLQQQLNLQRFGVRRFSNDNNLINFYTGFPNYKLFLAFYECI